VGIKGDIIVLILVAKTHDQLVEKDDEIDVNQALRKLQIIEGANDNVRNITLYEIVGAPRGGSKTILPKNSIFKKNSICMVIIDNVKDMTNCGREETLEIWGENTIEWYEDPIHLNYGRSNASLLCGVQMLDCIRIAIHVVRTMDTIVIHDVSHSRIITGVKRVQIFWDGQ
jgi:hypothetical protein